MHTAYSYLELLRAALSKSRSSVIPEGGGGGGGTEICQPQSPKITGPPWSSGDTKCNKNSLQEQFSKVHSRKRCFYELNV